MDNRLFFRDNVTEVKEEFEIEGIDKFKFPAGHEKEGKNVPWKIKKLKTKRIEDLTELCTTKKIKKGQKIIDVDQKRLGELIFAESIVFPDLKDKELQQQYNCIDNVSLLKEFLDIGVDYGRVFDECNSINNIQEEDEEEVIEKAKN